ncbi:hypothetical protein QBC37DRAFT_382422 [Rhypophila decipiens]|uniref:Uncharacterized protein n=1 Tax=Rhypophila decipiens TaxID=261697 RepID=A0AAN7BDC9_9PEZI|nr:hypothetical protein QBC37DRAFT_382422 [Rhypophila decipiens]
MMDFIVVHSSFLPGVPVVVPALLVAASALFFLSQILQAKPRPPQLRVDFTPDSKPKSQGNGPTGSRRIEKTARRVDVYKEVYYKVQNLEDYPEILPTARKLLSSLLEEGLILARFKHRARSILDLPRYDPTALDKFLEAERHDILDEFEAYVRDRKSGSRPSLYKTPKDAAERLKRNAPLNLVDGAWIARVHKITTPFVLRPVTRSLWQTLSEELGDGDVEKNHVVLYKQLLESVHVHLPDGDSPDFIDQEKAGINDQVAWRSAVGQLLVSLFPHDFLPEILGFNLHFESLATADLKAAHDLPEFGISPYYYALHISIDNADSGHSAMALDAIIRLMEIIKDNPGLPGYDLESTWKRIQAGYLLSQSINEDETIDDYHDKVADLLYRKAKLSGRIHCSSRAKIGGRALPSWFSFPHSPFDGLSDHEEGDVWKEEFLTTLADSKPWVYRGNSAKSMLMHSLSWKGKMFGAFTHSETELMRTWIDSLPSKDDSLPGGMYCRRVGTKANNNNLFSALQSDAATSHPVFIPHQKEWSPCKIIITPGFISRAPLAATTNLRLSLPVNLDAFLALWFAHPCLLENTVSSPYQTTTKLAALSLQILRADLGYLSDNSGIAGMDQQLHRQRQTPDLVSLGLEIIRRRQLFEPGCLKDVLEGSSCKQSPERSEGRDFAYDMLDWAMRPKRNGVFLLGLARGFLDLEVWVAGREELLGRQGRAALGRIVERKAEAFEAVLEDLEGTGRLGEFVAGYEAARGEIEKALGA